MPNTSDIRRMFVVISDDVYQWRRGWYYYLERRINKLALRFEKNKDVVVELLMARRGSYQRPFLHFSLMLLIAIGILSAPVLAESYPGSSIPDVLAEFTPPSAVATSLDFTEYGIKTTLSDKPRDQIWDHTVEEGETLGSVAEKYGVSVDSIKWANTLTRDTLAIGQVLKIPPVTGVVHKVKEGETIYSIAKRYDTDPQKIVNFPFNDFSDLDTFALNIGQTLIVPDGVVPSAQYTAPVGRSIPVPDVITGGTGQFGWPTSGSISQYPVWYHMALDIANRAAPGIAAADGGVVTLVQYLTYGYGQHIIISHGGGLQTLYAHLSEIYVAPGDSVAKGQVIGRMGSTGRSTGTHLHFEVRSGGVAVNPLPYVQ